MNKMVARILLGMALLMVASATSAHRLGESYVYLNVSEQALEGRIEVTLADIAKLNEFGGGADGLVSEEEFEAMADSVYAYLQPRLLFFDGETVHPIRIIGHDLMDIDVGTFALVRFDLPTLGSPPEEIGAEYRLLFDSVEPTHRGLLVIESNSRSGIKDNESQVSVIFGPGHERHEFSLEDVPWTQVFTNFVRHGVWHIWIGFDHILFLVALLLPSVLYRRERHWLPVETFREAFIYVLKVVTIFTVAHTITLSLAAMKVIEIPAQWVEAIIAISIAIVALNNLYPFLRGKTWLIVFVFGLFHGFGFANVLAPLGVNPQSTVSALLGFNVGVEIGQIAIVLVVFPILFFLRDWSLYRTRVLQLASLALIAISMFWFVERTVNVPFLSADMLSALGFVQPLVS